MNVDTAISDKHYDRHFFVPQHWRNTVSNILVTVTQKGSIVLAVKDEVVVFHNGLNFEKVSLKT